MADSKLTGLPHLSIVGGTKLYLVDESNNSRRTTVAELADYVAANPAEVPSGVFAGALVHRTTNMTAATGAYPVSWEATLYDTHGFWNGGAPTLLTIPSGVSRVQFYGNVRHSAVSSGFRSLEIRRASVGLTVGRAINSHVYANGSATRLNVTTPIMDVTPGESYYLESYSSVSTQVLSDLMTWFAVKVCS